MQQLVSYSFQTTDEGMYLQFPVSFALDRFSVPRNNRMVWGQGRIGLVAVVKTRHGAALAVPGRDPRYLEWQGDETATSFALVIPIASKPEFSQQPDDSWLIFGAPSPQRDLENHLVRLGRDLLQRHQQRRCFSCHEILPFGLAVREAERRGLSLPFAVIASVSASILEFQGEDGSFAFPAFPEFGVVTPTLVGGMVLAMLPGAASSTADGLLRITGFLAQRNRDELVPPLDFSFPSMLIGRGFSGWALLTILNKVFGVMASLIQPFEQVVGELYRNAWVWLADPGKTVFDGELFRLLSTVVAVDDLPQDLRKRITNDLLDRLCYLDRAVAPDAAAIYEGVLLQLGHPAATFASWLEIMQQSSEADNLSLLAWSLYAQLCRETPVE